MQNQKNVENAARLIAKDMTGLKVDAVKIVDAKNWTLGTLSKSVKRDGSIVYGYMSELSTGAYVSGATGAEIADDCLVLTNKKGVTRIEL